MNPTWGPRLSPINLVLISTNRRVKFSANGNTMRMCVSAKMLPLSCAPTSLAYLPLRYSSLLPLSAPLNPDSCRADLRLCAIRRTDRPRRHPGTQSGEHFNWDTKRGGWKKGEERVAEPWHHFTFCPICVAFLYLTPLQFFGGETNFAAMERCKNP